ncbi:TPA: hypothetical protein DCZ31_05675 [Patescibacteria group bacterium]|nr:hypothetical protein [Candidatus Gracilibacteria bacterium]
MKRTSLLVVLLLALSLSVFGCGSKGQTGAAAGALGGALLGQAIGHNAAGTLIGAAVGGGLGYMIGNEMDKSDAEAMNRAYEQNRNGQTSSWRNPNTGDSYRVTPKKTYHDRRTNQDCRDAEVLATINGQPKKLIQKACRDNQGNWIAVN